jgi:hypothetical protein
MRKISAWAKYHPYQARVYIVLIKVALFIAAIFTGRLFNELSIHLSPLTGVAAGALLIIASFIYPKKTISRFVKKKSYAFRKRCDFVLAFSTFMLISVLANNNHLFIYNTPSSAATQLSITRATPPTAEEILASLKYRDKSTLTHQEKRILKKEFEKQLTIYAKAKVTGDKDGEKAVLIILTIIGAIGLSLLLGALACSISCGGADGLAILVAVVGLTGIIWGSIVLIKRITKLHSKKANTTPGPVSN